MTRRPTLVLMTGVCVAAILATGCQASPTNSSTPPAPDSKPDSQACITDFDATKDYFPDKVSFSDATNVTVEYKNSYKVVTVKQPVAGGAPESYVLLQCGAPEPTLDGDLASATKVTIPAKRIVAASTTQLTGYELTDTVDHLAGVGGAPKTYDGPVWDAIQAGRITDVKNDGMKLSVEGIAAATPDLVVHGGTADPAHEQLRALGIPVVADAEHLENTPLGRAEWIKFTSLFVNAEGRATEEYTKVKKAYDEAAAKAKTSGEKPEVLAGLLSKGIFYGAGDESYVAALVKDAGGTLALADDAKGTGSTQLGMEVVLAKGGNAPYWINALMSGRWDSMATPLQDEPRLAELASVKEGNVWNYSKKINERGSNDYWQSGVTRPDLVLADLVAILHPEQAAGHEFTYYERVPK